MAESRGARASSNSTGDCVGTLCGALDGARLDAVCARLSSSARERIAYAPGDLLGITLEKSDQFF